MITTQRLAHIKISIGNKTKILDQIERNISDHRHSYCIPLNLTKYVLSKNDAKLRKTINSADLVIADGLPIVWLSRKCGCYGVYRVTGIDLAESIFSISKIKGWKFYFLGAKPIFAEKAVRNMEKLYKLSIPGYHHGYYKSCEIPSIIEHINNLDCDVLLLGLGLPQKEHFINDFYEKIRVSFCLPIGGAFDVWAGEKKRTPKVFQMLGTEWLYRSLYDRSKAILILKYCLYFLKDLYFYKK